MTNRTEQTFSYYVVMIDHGRRGLEAVVDPEITRRAVVDRIRSGEYQNISFIHHITMNDVPADVTAELKAEALVRVFDDPSVIDLQAARFDHARDLRKHEVV